MSTARAELGRLLQRTLGLNAGAVRGSSVDEAVRKRMAVHEVRSRAKYLAILRCSRQERIALVEAIELPAVGFFEHSESLVALQRWVTNHWLARPSKKPLRVLSVPCATGEEPYSLAITLLEAGLQQSQFHIDAADINDHALRRAAAAVYQDGALRLVTDFVRERYFQRELNGHRLAPQVRTQVSFLKSDLFGRMMLDTAYDIIFGRSLMMYFVPQAQQRILRRLEHLLQPGGLLIVGPTLGRNGPRVPVPAWVEVLEQAHIPGRGGSRAVHRGDNRLQLREAATLLESNRFEEAAGICIRVLDEHRASAQAVYLLGRIAEARGRHAEAREFFRRALYLQPRHRQAAEHLSHLAGRRPPPRRKAA
jgi:chemotaxis protein methyltransferase WspC